jgi:hypothetical protein
MRSVERLGPGLGVGVVGAGARLLAERLGQLAEERPDRRLGEPMEKCAVEHLADTAERRDVGGGEGQAGLARADRGQLEIAFEHREESGRAHGRPGQSDHARVAPRSHRAQTDLDLPSDAPTGPGGTESEPQGLSLGLRPPGERREPVPISAEVRPDAVVTDCDIDEVFDEDGVPPYPRPIRRRWRWPVLI